MPWIQSHQEIRDHPKTRRVARRLGVGIPVVVGHLHLLWHWALDNAPDGNLTRFDDEDLADAAMWEGDASEFVKALTECGPGKGPGFIEKGRRLHDWAEYGGRYGRRVAAAKKAAAKRWERPDDDATAEQPQCDGNANASESHSERIDTPAEAPPDEPDATRDAATRGNDAFASQPHAQRNADREEIEKTTLSNGSSSTRKRDTRPAEAIIEHIAALVDSGINVPSPGGLRRTIERDQGADLRAWFDAHPDASVLEGCHAVLGTTKPQEPVRLGTARMSPHVRW